jgi:hypothetical protein
MKQHLLLSACFSLAAAAPVAAQVVPIGPFVGDNSDSFETQASQGQSGFTACMIGRILQNTADMCTPGANGIHITGGWSFGCQIAPNSGGWLHGTAGGTGTEITFDNPVSQFGGYFGNNSPNAANFTATFYDASDNVIGMETFPQANDCVWVWHGWSIAPGATRATFVNDQWGGAFIMMDDLEATLDTGGGITIACVPANPHSQGGPATLGSSSISGPGVLHLECTAGPPNEFGYFLVSLTLVDPGTPISNGILCLGAPTGRYAPAAGGTFNSIGQFDASGVLQNLAGTSTVGSGYDVLATLPTPPGGVITPGTSYYFQCWFRDGNRSNFSDVAQFQ